MSKLSKNISGLNNSVKEYVQTKIDLAKLSLLEKSTRLTTYFISLLILIIFLTLITGILTTAFVIWYGTSFGNYLEGTLIASGFLTVFAIVVILLRKKLIMTSVLKNLSEIIFEEDNDG